LTEMYFNNITSTRVLHLRLLLPTETAMQLRALVLENSNLFKKQGVKNH